MILADVQTVIAIHEASIRRFGGASGVRDMGLVESAVGRVQTAIGYNPDIDVSEAAAMICHGIMKNHAFIDGNKRTGYGVMVSTLAVNGYKLEVSSEEITEKMIETAASSAGHEDLTSWIRDRISPDETYRLLAEYDAEEPSLSI